MTFSENGARASIVLSSVDIPGDMKKQRANTPPHVIWSDAEWLLIFRELMTTFPDLGLPKLDNVKNVRLRHMARAMQALPASRRRHLVALTSIRPRLEKLCRLAAVEPQREDTAPSKSLGFAVPTNLVYRQPDGRDNGPPKQRKVFWLDDEWYSLAVELAYRNPAFLETLHPLTPADVFRAQRVLPSNRRRPQTSLIADKVRAGLTPAFRKLRAAIDAARREKDDAERATAERAAAERAAAERERVIKDLVGSPEFVAAAVGAAPLSALLDAFGAQLAAGAQKVIEAALVNVLTSEQFKKSLIFHIHMEAPQDAPAAPKAASVTSDAGKAEIHLKPKVGIIGALAQQGEVLISAFPQLHIKPVDKNLSGQELRAAIKHFDRVIAMTDFISHSIDGVCSKTLGDRYYRCSGGVSAVRHLVGTWLASGFAGAGSA